MNTLKLIDLVQSKDALWNIRSNFYHNRELKNLIWSDIAREVGISRETAKAKWSSLRDSFRRELRKRSDPYYNGSKSEWPLFYRMMFLAPFVNIKDGTFEGTRFEDTSMYKERLGETSHMQDLSSEMTERNITEPPSTDQTGSSEASNEIPLREPPTNENSPQSAFPSYTKFNSPVFNDYSDYNSHSRMMMKKRVRREKKKDEDYHFLMSLFSSMKRIPPEKKMTARIRIMQVLSELDVYTSTNEKPVMEKSQIKENEQVETSSSPSHHPASSMIIKKEVDFNECDLTD